MTRQPPTRFAGRHLLGIDGVLPGAIAGLLDRADALLDGASASPLLQGHRIVTVFPAAATRTQTAFERAGRQLGADIVAMPPIPAGETLSETARAVKAERSIITVVRHPDAGAVSLLARHLDGAVINAGDGAHEHPTRALIDALTIRRAKGRIEGLIVALCGNIRHSAVARSHILLLSRMDALIRVVAPSPLLPVGIEAMGVEVFHAMRVGLRDADVIVDLGHAVAPNGSGPSHRDYAALFGLDTATLALARPDVLIVAAAPEDPIPPRAHDDAEHAMLMTVIEALAQNSLMEPT